jgi:hypothetical protein
VKSTTFRYGERVGIAAVAVCLIGAGFYLLPDAALLGNVEVEGKDLAFRGSVPLFVMGLGVALLIALVYWGGARSTQKATTKTTQRPVREPHKGSES